MTYYVVTFLETPQIVLKSSQISLILCALSILMW